MWCSNSHAVASSSTHEAIRKTSRSLTHTSSSTRPSHSPGKQSEGEGKIGTESHHTLRSRWNGNLSRRQGHTLETCNTSLCAYASVNSIAARRSEVTLLGGHKVAMPTEKWIQGCRSSPGGVKQRIGLENCSEITGWELGRRVCLSACGTSLMLLTPQISDPQKDAEQKRRAKQDRFLKLAHRRATFLTVAKQHCIQHADTAAKSDRGCV